MNNTQIQKMKSGDSENYGHSTSVADLTAYRCQFKCVQKEEKLEKTLKELEHLKLALDKTAIVAIANEKGIISYVNEKFCDVSGYQQQELIGQNFNLLNSAYHTQEFFKDLWLTISSGKVWQGEIRDRTKDGKYYWVNTTIVPFLNEQNKPWQYLSIQLEITAKKEAEIALNENLNRYQNLVNSSPEGIFITDSHGKFIEANNRWYEMTGLTLEEARKNGWAKSINAKERGQILAKWYLGIWKKLPVQSCEYCLHRPDGQVTSVLARTIAETNIDGEVVGYVATITDISDRKQAEKKLHHNVWYDSLTGLPNRALFLQQVESALSRANNREKLFAVLFLDLNRFKVINDSLGHLQGDRLLCEVAKRLTEVVPKKELVARLGGDQFLLLLEDVESLNAVLQVANRIQKQLAQPLYLEENQVFTGASIGIVLCGSQKQVVRETEITRKNAKAKTIFPHSVLPNLITYHEKPEEILRAAHTAMYRAKDLGGNSRYLIFNPQMHERAVALLNLESDLRRAVKSCEEFVVHYQPIISNETGKICGFEALVRWQHPTKGFISPGEFISLAEETDLIIPLGEHVLSQALLQLKNWQSLDANKSLTMSVNISPKQLSHPDFLEKIDKILRDTGVESHRVNLEITESSLMDNPEAAVEILLELRKRGIRLSIDDFGTGYSSLSHLSKFPLNTLKIDRSFVKQMGERGENSSMIWTIVTLAHNLGLDVVAEGVETNLQLELLTKLRCEKIQGYLFSPPVEAEAAAALLAVSVQKKQKNSGQESNLLVRDRLGNNFPERFIHKERLFKRRLANKIRNYLDFNSIVKTTVNELRHLMQADCCQFLWYREDLEVPMFEPMRKTCQLETVCEGCLKPSTPSIAVVGEVLLESGWLRIDDVARDRQLDTARRDYLSSKGLKSLLAYTVRPNFGSTGVIVCERTNDRRPWLDEEVELLAELSDQLALAIDYGKGLDKK